VQDQTEKDANASALRNQQKGKIVQRFHSRRGCLITLTFPEMDAVPEILTRRPQPQRQQQQQQQQEQQESSTTSSSSPTDPSSQEQSQHEGPLRCVITGKPAKYKDPLTKFPYYNLEAFKELRRRHENGIPIDVANGSSKPKQESSGNGEPATNPPDNAASTTSIPPVIKENDNTKPKKPAVSTNPRPPSATLPSKYNATKPSSKPVGPPKSKLPFQSPKPEPKPAAVGASNVTDGAKDSSTSAATHSQAPSIEHLKFSWGQSGSSNTDSQESPSGRRLSRRTWKPSEKVLETISMSPKKDGVIAAPPGLLIKPEQVMRDGNFVPSIPAAPSLSNTKPENNGKEVSTTTTAGKKNTTNAGPKPASVAGEKSADKITTKKKTAPAKSKAPGTQKKAPTKRSTAKPKPAPATRPKAAKAVPSSTTAVVCASKKTSANAPPHTSAAVAPPSKARGSKPSSNGTTMKIPSPELEKQLQNLYEVPKSDKDGGDNGNGASSNDESSQPQYITQGALIQEVISNYAKRHVQPEETTNPASEQPKSQENESEPTHDPPAPPPIDNNKEDKKEEK
jgi:hypothetical protein